jgi:hypothetical protein
MNILATVNFGQRQITQSWEYLEGEPSPYLLLMKLENGDLFAISLETRFEREVEGQKCYLATLNVSDAIVVTPTSE